LAAVISEPEDNL